VRDPCVHLRNPHDLRLALERRARFYRICGILSATAGELSLASTVESACSDMRRLQARGPREKLESTDYSSSADDESRDATRCVSRKNRHAPSYHRGMQTAQVSHLQASAIENDLAWVQGRVENPTLRSVSDVLESV
jgi:hypothetical protein